MSKILLVEDDINLATGIEYSLQKEDYRTELAKNFAEGRALVNKNTYDLIIIDIGLPDGNGFNLCKHIRTAKQTPVIFLTAQDEEVNVVMGLDLGADDYITKPFRIRELISRIKAVLRRYATPSSGKVLKSRNIEINLEKAQVFVKEKVVLLTPSEYKLLLMLMKYPHQVLSRQVVLANLWDTEGDFVDDNSLSVYIKRLRDKIEKYPSKPQYIKTVRGLGYRWDIDVRGEWDVKKWRV